MPLLLIRSSWWSTMAFLLSPAVAVCLHVNFWVYFANAHLITNLLEVLPRSFAMANA
jgi:hypothetical protein